MLEFPSWSCLPNCSKAVIAPEKLRDYLLSPGWYKALFFRTLGYDQTSWQQLETDLRSLASLPAEPLESTEYGTKYAIIGPLAGLNGRVAEIVTVWIQALVTLATASIRPVGSKDILAVRQLDAA